MEPKNEQKESTVKKDIQTKKNSNADEWSEFEKENDSLIRPMDRFGTFLTFTDFSKFLFSGTFHIV